MFKPTNIGGNKKAQQKPAKKPNFSAMHKLSSSTSTQSAAQPTEPSSDAPGAPPQSGPKLTQTRGYEDWLANDEEMDWVYDRQQQEREQRKAKKKNKKKNKYEEKVRSWDDIYDPTVPVPIAEFARSDFHYDLEEEWKQRLYEANKREKIRQGKYERSGDVDMDEGPRESGLPLLADCVTKLAVTNQWQVRARACSSPHQVRCPSHRLLLSTRARAHSSGRTIRTLAHPLLVAMPAVGVSPVNQQHPMRHPHRLQTSTWKRQPTKLTLDAWP